MLDHISITAADFAKAKSFYSTILAPLGISPQMEFPEGVGYGQSGTGIPMFWLVKGERTKGGGHVAFRAPSREAVRKFHAAGLAAGGRDEGAPGIRADYHANYYAAFLWDPEGCKVEAVIHTPEK